MFAGLAMGDRKAGIDHLLSHGAFKALLFLAAGCLMHAVGTSALAAMGGLRRAMPLTFVGTTIGLGALAGIIPTSGFFTKDAIIEAARHATNGSGPVSGGIAWLVLLVALATALITAAYSMRLWLKVFFGPEQKTHEAPAAMTWPVLLLAGVTIALSIGKPFHLGTGVLTTVLAAAGIGLIWWVRERRLRLPLTAIRGPLRAEAGFDRIYSDWIPAAFGYEARSIVNFDRDGVDAYSRAVALLAGRGSALLARTQAHNVQRYATALVVGIAGFVLVAVIRG